jgi:hypothetical protein
MMLSVARIYTIASYVRIIDEFEGIWKRFGRKQLWPN